MIGVTPRTVSGWELGEYPPEPEHASRLAGVLKYPPAFFEAEDLELPSKDAVSFRSMTSMKAAQRDAVIAACAIATEVNDWLVERYNLPELDLPDLRYDSPEVAAAALRQHWKLGLQPITNMVHLLEKKGVRVFSLSQNCKEVDACSVWLAGAPYVFLNTFKSAERSRMDAAHELGHLVLHRHGAPNGQEAENQANTFARYFLMPEDAIRAEAPAVVTMAELIRIKRHWNVSVAALAYHYGKLGLVSEWHYRSLAIEIQTRGYRTNEPYGSEREQSRLWSKLFQSLRVDGVSKLDLADELKLPASEISELLFGLVLSSVSSESGERATPPKRGHLKLVANRQSDA